MLGTKCGWLAKRNEQRVWQKRWCVVVPHTFLYYFEASPVEVKSEDNDDGNIHTHEAWSGGGINVNLFATLDQDALNLAVKDGYDENGAGYGTGKKSLYQSLPNIMGGGGGNGGTAAGGGGEHGAHEDVFAWDPEHLGVNGPLTPTIGGDGDTNNKGTYQFVSSSNLQPVGIIDLECYTAVNRSNINPTVMELAGDSVTNPDLRSFYFQSATVEDAESWIKALLTDRHQSLKDETEAYRQVCESFPLQLANCSEMIDAAEAAAEAMEREAYSVRSACEEGRRKVVSAVRDILERKCWDTETSKREMKGKIGKNGKMNGLNFGDDGLKLGRRAVGFEFEEKKNTTEENVLLDSVLDAHYEKLETNRAAFLRELEATLSSPSAIATSDVLPPVQTLTDYTSAIIVSFGDLRSQLQKYEKDLRNAVKQDQSELEELKGAIEGRDAQIADAERKLTMIASDLKSDLEASQQQVDELTKQLEAQRMEFRMYQNATKTKLSELQQHKKILKKEVIELRKKVDECGSENTTIAHEYERVKSSYQNMKDKNSTLERYVDRLEKQVGVQQNMMEMMSQSGAASFLGKIVGPGAAQNDSRDVISLSGMSGYSQNIRCLSPGAGAHAGDVKSTNCIPVRTPRPLLPPESKGRNIRDVSPLPMPMFPNTGANCTMSLGEVADEVVCREDDRDTSPAYYRSEGTANEDGSGAFIGDVATSPSTTSSRKTPHRDLSVDVPDCCASGILSDPTVPKLTEEFLSSNPADNKNESSSLRVAAMAAAGVPSPEIPSNTDAVLYTNNSMDHQLDVNTSPHSDDAEMTRSEHLGTAEVEDDDLDDNVSRVSDITEDRTQRQLDDDLAERRKILLAYVNKTYVNKTPGESSNLSLQSSTQRRLETIENLFPRESAENPSGETIRSNGSGQLSVAQRARLEAENRSNVHRSPSPAKRKSEEATSQAVNPQSRDDASIMSTREGSFPSSNSVVTSSSRADTVGRTGSFFKNIGRAIEKTLDNTVLGVGLADNESYGDETESEILSSVVSDASVRDEFLIRSKSMSSFVFTLPIAHFRHNLWLTNKY